MSRFGFAEVLDGLRARLHRSAVACFEQWVATLSTQSLALSMLRTSLFIYLYCHPGWRFGDLAHVELWRHLGCAVFAVPSALLFELALLAHGAQQRGYNASVADHAVRNDKGHVRSVYGLCGGRCAVRLAWGLRGLAAGRCPKYQKQIACVRICVHALVSTCVAFLIRFVHLLISGRQPNTLVQHGWVVLVPYDWVAYLFLVCVISHGARRT